MEGLPIRSGGMVVFATRKDALDWARELNKRTKDAIDVFTYEELHDDGYYSDHTLVRLLTDINAWTDTGILALASEHRGRFGYRGIILIPPPLRDPRRNCRSASVMLSATEHCPVICTV